MQVVSACKTCVCMFVVMCGVCKCVYSCMFIADSTVALDSGHMVVAEYGNLVHHAISPVPSVANNSGSSGEEGGSSGEEGGSSGEEGGSSGEEGGSNGEEGGSSGEEGGSSGEESRDSTQRLFVLSVYSVEAMIVVEPVRDSASDTYGCALLLVGRDGQVTATSEWIPVWVVQCMYVLVHVGYIVCAQATWVVVIVLH